MPATINIFSSPCANISGELQFVCLQTFMDARLENHRRKIRVNHLALAIIVKRMRAGAFSPRQLTELSGLSRASVIELLDTFEHQGLITFIGKTPMPGPTGRREKLFREVR